MQTYFAIIILAFLSGITTLIGVAAAYAFKKSDRLISIGLGFSTGIMVFIALFEIMPAALAENGDLSSGSFILGLACFALLNYALPHVHLHNGKYRKSCLRASAYLCAIGFVLHDFPEGFAMANSYILSVKLGIYIALIIALHNIPEEFAMAVPAVLSGMAKKNIVLIAFFSGLSEPAGALIGILFARMIPSLTPLFLAFAAGAMVFIALHELYPIAKKFHQLPSYALGIFLAAAIHLILSAFLV